MIRFLVDEDFNNDILRGLRRRLPDVDAPRIQALGLAGVSDETVLALAATENRVVLTHDVSTLVASAYRRLEAGEPMPGVIAVAQSTLAGVVIEDLVVIVECSSAEDWRDQVHYLPFR
jgi:predicted nuclease of predicted toxin-antitoxin system